MMTDSNESIAEIKTSMENPDLDDRPAVFRLTNIDPAKKAKVNSLKEIKTNATSSSRNITIQPLSQYKNNRNIYEDSWWDILKNFLKPWQWNTLIVLIIFIFSYHIFSYHIDQGFSQKGDYYGPDGKECVQVYDPDPNDNVGYGTTCPQ